MRIIADLHIHSRYSRATSKEMEVPEIARYAELKGINLVGTGDFTHPAYLAELKEHLEETGSGLLRLKEGGKVHFMLSTEVSNIYHQGGKLRKIHTLIFAPSFALADRIVRKLDSYGKLESDGRPTFGFPASDLVKMMKDISDDIVIVPAHAWTPWFSVFGSNSGFDSLEECFGDARSAIFAIETGLSSDPEMNWRVSALDSVSLISNSDAHSPKKLGREANVFDCEPDYYRIFEAIKERDRRAFLFTVEFYPEEGKYHYDGHRNCGILFSPKESIKHNNICPVCGKPLTIGVMHRVEELADRPEGYTPPGAIPSRHLVPLAEIIASAYEQGAESKRVEEEYLRLINRFGSEFEILLDVPEEDLRKATNPKIAEGIIKVRQGRLKITPGYDGVFGKIEIFGEAEEEEKNQLSLF
ncbi:MAG: DNA helicase UvrD [Acidobacteria bacterium]|nr:DNA helicase UvrD [Acidobacteriota bacterium]